MKRLEAWLSRIIRAELKKHQEELLIDLRKTRKACSLCGQMSWLYEANPESHAIRCLDCRKNGIPWA